MNAAASNANVAPGPCEDCRRSTSGRCGAHPIISINTTATVTFQPPLPLDVTGTGTPTTFRPPWAQ